MKQQIFEILLKNLDLFLAGLGVLLVRYIELKMMKKNGRLISKKKNDVQ